MKKRIIIKVEGRVQKVFFRKSAQTMAKKLGLSGWVKNESNNMVLMTAEGEEEKLKAFYEWAKRGPILARVIKIEERWEENKNEFSDFEIKY